MFHFDLSEINKLLSEAGLLPNGHAKVWLYGCLDYIYVDELAPFKVMEQDYDGRKASELTSTPQYFQLIKKQANDLGQSLSPIPWDKVNKTYWQKDISHVYSLDDYNDQGELIHPRVEPAPAKTKPYNRCWANKPPESTTPIKPEKSSPQYVFQRTLWEYTPEMLAKVNDVDGTINDAWDEAKQQGLDEDHTQSWVLARLAALTDYPLSTLYKELKISSKGQQYITQYVEEMCQ